MRNSIFTKAAISAAGILAVLALWQALAAKYPPLILPSPVETLEALVELWQSGGFGQQPDHVSAHFGRIRLAFLAEIAVALTCMPFLCRWMLQPDHHCTDHTACCLDHPGGDLVRWPRYHRHLSGFVVTFPVSSQCLFRIWLDAKLVEMAEVYRCSPAQVIIHVYLPSLLPHLVSAASVGCLCLEVGGVCGFIGSSSGVGFALSMAYSNLETEKVFAWTVILIVVMFAFEYGVLGAAKRRATRWVHHE